MQFRVISPEKWDRSSFSHGIMNRRGNPGAAAAATACLSRAPIYY